MKNLQQSSNEILRIACPEYFGCAQHRLVERLRMTNFNFLDTPLNIIHNMSRTLVIISRIIFYYSIFYVVLKLIAVLSGKGLLPNLILAVPFALLALIGWRMEKRRNYNWIYVIAGVLFISIVRYYESEWMIGLEQFLDDSGAIGVEYLTN